MSSRFFRRGADSDDSDSSSSSEEELMSTDDEGAPKPETPAPAAARPMSRFLRGSDSDDSDGDSDDTSGGSLSEIEQAPQQARSRYLEQASDEDESDEDVRRVVKSARDKRLDEIEATGKVMENALKINDWVAISTGWLN
jgi:translation initiation factor 3 subunit C